jgi:hypothetical protein
MSSLLSAATDPQGEARSDAGTQPGSTGAAQQRSSTPASGAAGGTGASRSPLAGRQRHRRNSDGSSSSGVG